MTKSSTWINSNFQNDLSDDDDDYNRRPGRSMAYNKSGSRRHDEDDDDDQSRGERDSDAGSDDALVDDEEDFVDKGRTGRTNGKGVNKIIQSSNSKHIRNGDNAISMALASRENHKEIPHLGGTSKIEAALRHFKKVSYTFMQNGRIKQMKKYYAHPNSSDHLREFRSTFEVPYSDSQTIRLGYMFNNIEQYLGALMSAYINEKNTPLTPAGMICANTMMIHTLVVTNVISTRMKAMSVNVDGIRDRFAVPSHKSWEPSQPSLAVLTPGMNNYMIFEYDLASSPNLHAIHGIHNLEEDAKKGVAAWGEVRGDYVAVNMQPSRFDWLMWNLVPLIKSYIKQNTDKAVKLDRRLPDGLTKDIWTAAKEFYGDRILGNVYEKDAKLNNDWIGRLLRILNPQEYEQDAGKKKKLLWNVVEDGLCFRVPTKFIEFAISNHRDGTETVKMVSTDNLSMTTNATITDGDEPFKPSDKMTFGVSALGFTPRMYFVVSDKKTDDDEYDESRE